MEDHRKLIICRNGERIAEIDITAIANAIMKAFESVAEYIDQFEEQARCFAHDFFHMIMSFLDGEMSTPSKIPHSWYYSWMLNEVRDLTRNYKWTWFEDALCCHSLPFMINRLQESSETFDARTDFNEALVVCS